MKPLVEIVTPEDDMIPCLLWKGYRDGNILFSYTEISHVKNILYKKFCKKFLAKTLYML